MTNPLAKIIFDNSEQRLILCEELGQPCSHQLQGNCFENLCEVAGRICYDSLANPKTRGSEDYFAHIIEVGHLSVLEHCNFLVSINADSNCLKYFTNRPGVIVEEEDRGLFVSFNPRSVIDWDNHTTYDNETNTKCKATLQEILSNLMPLLKIKNDSGDKTFNYSLIDPNLYDKDLVWISFLISNVSRNLTHELVRHKYQVAISQRSTRYVDESKSNFCYHPLINEDPISNPWEQECRYLYIYENENIRDQLISKGVDKFTALKQARGAARSFLPSCLSTELVFSASLKQWKHILLSRMSRHADAEIRLLSNQIYQEIKERYPLFLHEYRTGDCPDGIGKELVKV